MCCLVVILNIKVGWVVVSHLLWCHTYPYLHTKCHHTHIHPHLSLCGVCYSPSFYCCYLRVQSLLCTIFLSLLFTHAAFVIHTCQVCYSPLDHHSLVHETTTMITWLGILRSTDPQHACYCWPSNPPA